MAIPAVFSSALGSFPSLDTYPSRQYRFDKPSDLGAFDFYTDATQGPGLGHDGPTACANVDAGGLVLGSGSTVSGSYVQMQEDCLASVATRLARNYWFIFNIQLSSASLAQATVGVFSLNTNFNASVIANGFGAYANLTGGLSSTNWTFFLANGAATQFTSYAQVVGPACDTLAHTLAIQYITDPVTLGAGQMLFYWDGVAQPSGSTFASTSAIFPQVALGMGASLGNGSAAAQTLTINSMAAADKR